MSFPIRGQNQNKVGRSGKPSIKDLVSVAKAKIEKFYGNMKSVVLNKTSIMDLVNAKSQAPKDVSSGSSSEITSGQDPQADI